MRQEGLWWGSFWPAAVVFQEDMVLPLPSTLTAHSTAWGRCWRHQSRWKTAFALGVFREPFTSQKQKGAASWCRRRCCNTWRRPLPLTCSDSLLTGTVINRGSHSLGQSLSSSNSSCSSRQATCDRKCLCPLLTRTGLALARSCSSVGHADVRPCPSQGASCELALQMPPPQKNKMGGSAWWTDLEKVPKILLEDLQELPGSHVRILMLRGKAQSHHHWLPCRR